MDISLMNIERRKMTKIFEADNKIGISSVKARILRVVFSIFIIGLPYYPDYNTHLFPFLKIENLGMRVILVCVRYIVE
jgi:hypothetical protein